MVHLILLLRHQLQAEPDSLTNTSTKTPIKSLKDDFDPVSHSFLLLIKLFHQLHSDDPSYLMLYKVYSFIQGGIFKKILFYIFIFNFILCIYF